MSELERLAIDYVKAREAYFKARAEYNDFCRRVRTSPDEQMDLSMFYKIERAKKLTRKSSRKAEAALRVYVLERSAGE